jgi:hypothetical protein
MFSLKRDILDASELRSKALFSIFGFSPFFGDPGVTLSLSMSTLTSDEILRFFGLLAVFSNSANFQNSLNSQKYIIHVYRRQFISLSFSYVNKEVWTHLLLHHYPHLRT